MHRAPQDPHEPPGRPAESWRRIAVDLVRDVGRDGWQRARDHGPQVALVIGVVLVVLGTAGFLGVFDALQEGDDLATLDQPVLEGLAARRSEVLTVVLTLITTVTGPEVLPVLVLLGCLTWGWFGRAWWQAGLLAAAMILSTVVSVSLKSAVGRERPPVDTMSIPGAESTYSFPSGHTIGTATLLLTVGYLMWIRRPGARSLITWTVSILLGTALVALSRLYLGYHFVTDVVASMALAVAVLGVVVVVDRERAVRAARVTAGERPRQDSNLRPAD